MITFTVRGIPAESDDGDPRRAGLGPVLDLLAAIRADRLGDDDWLISFVHDGDPASKARPRWSGRGRRTYTPSETVAAENALALRFRAAMRERGVIEGNVAIAAVFYRPNHQRIDADNLMKLVLDSATKAGVWLDDSQVTAQASVVELDVANPRTIVALGPTASTLVRGPLRQTCPRCGAEFDTRRNARRIYCSTACAQPPTTARCARCDVEFRRRSAGQRYCSKACAAADGHHRTHQAGR